MATRNIVPRATGEGGLGVSGKRWGTAYINNLNISSIAGTSGTIVDLNASAFGESVQGTIRGKNKEIFKTASADSPLTATECCGTIVSNYGMTDADCVISLPAAAEGLAFVCILPAVRARYFRLDPAAGDSVYLSGVTTGDGKYVGVASGYAAATSASFFTFKTGASAYDWFCIPIFGTWVAEAA